MKHPDFKHRAMPDGGDYEELTPIDLISFISDKTTESLDMADSLEIQLDLQLADPKLNNLNALRNNIRDIRVMSDWFFENFEVVRTENNE